MKRLLAAMTAALVIVATFGTASVAAAPATGITATPASTVTWAGTYTAKFVRSASGIINETNRVNSAGAQNNWTSADVYLQFRPLTGPSGTGSPTPNPACDPNGLVTPVFTYVNSDPTIAGTPTDGYFIGSNPYNVCVYLVNPQVTTGTVDSAVIAGTTATLPSGLNGHFRIDVSGEWNNTSHGLVDAQYNNGDNGLVEAVTWQMGWPGLGDGWGRLLVNGGLIDWGTFNASHAYSYTLSASGSITLNIFDGDASSGLVYVPSWYSDNVGSLTYTITYLGL